MRSILIIFCVLIVWIFSCTVTARPWEPYKLTDGGKRSERATLMEKYYAAAQMEDFNQALDAAYGAATMVTSALGIYSPMSDLPCPRLPDRVRVVRLVGEGHYLFTDYDGDVRHR